MLLDLRVIWQGASLRLFGGIRAPSTLGTLLQGFTWAMWLYWGQPLRCRQAA
jgi:hypothetical protein